MDLRSNERFWLIVRLPESEDTLLFLSRKCANFKGAYQSPYSLNEMI
jgi:hypothetical protein